MKIQIFFKFFFHQFLSTGYPDLKSIMEYFDDMFVVGTADAPNEWSERSEITFNQQSVCKISS